MQHDTLIVNTVLTDMKC